MANSRNPRKPVKKNHQTQTQTQNARKPEEEKPPSWAVVRSFLTCKHVVQAPPPPPQQPSRQEKKHQKKEQPSEETAGKKCKKMKCSGSLCSNTKVMHRPEPASPPEESKKLRASSSMDGSGRSSGLAAVVVSNCSGNSGSMSSSGGSSSSSSAAGSFRGMPFRRLSGCYECRMVVDPVLGFTRDPSLRATICSCPDCGEVFMKAENLELHQAVRHAVSELGPEDTSKNIVEIIFQSSWLRKQSPVCKIDRILKVHNTQKTISKFEEYRDAIKAKATKLPKKHPRCVADGNELLRFHCTTFDCSLGLNGSTNLCNSIPTCNVCSIIRNGFKVAAAAGKGILTTATSGKAHDEAAGAGPDDGKRAMLVCRVIAGRVKKSSEGVAEEYDSVAGAAGAYANLEELYVFNPRAILPCFVVIYGGFN
ncbi:uncharacterized protein LOC127807291 [Diospyros lotus]|uniref:uncharacterized protein LOC127807291 n=1 Tax=Diospyros lotus TaxID=55363 RepID=UPI0022555566|nr:uncharacterized protein LOC127807291 [Diospyros lotus]